MLKMSTAEPVYSPPALISGARYQSVPTSYSATLPSWVDDLLKMALNPKSMILSSNSEFSIRFSHLRSRWLNPIACKCRMALQSCLKKYLARFSWNMPVNEMNSNKSPPSQYSCTMATAGTTVPFGSVSSISRLYS